MYSDQIDTRHTFYDMCSHFKKKKIKIIEKEKPTSDTLCYYILHHCLHNKVQTHIFVITPYLKRTEILI